MMDNTPDYIELIEKVKRLEAIAIAHEKTEEKLRLHLEIMTNMAEGVYLIRLSDGKIVYANPKFEKMFGYERGEMLGKHVSIVNAPITNPPEETAEEIMAVLHETGEWHGEVHNIKKDGTPFWCHANVSTLNHAEYGEVLVAVHSDITVRKAAEIKNATLQRRLASLWKISSMVRDDFKTICDTVLLEKCG